MKSCAPFLEDGSFWGVIAAKWGRIAARARLRAVPNLAERQAPAEPINTPFLVVTLLFKEETDKGPIMPPLRVC